MRTYLVLERYIDGFEEVGKVVEDNGSVFLVGFKEENEKFYSEIGFGERAYTPRDKEYIDVLIEKFMFSSSIAIKPIEVAKGGPGSGSWNAPGSPRFQHQGKPKENLKIDRRFSMTFDNKEEMKLQLKDMNLSIKQIQDLCDLKEASKVELEIQGVFNGVYTIAEWFDKDAKRIGRFEVMIEDENDTVGTPKRAEIDLLKADNTNIGLRRFYREAEVKLKSMGIKEIHLCADITIGKYFWAKEGYNFLVRRDLLMAKDKMINFTKDRLKKFGKTKTEIDAVVSNINKIKNAKEMAEFDCGIRVKPSIWDCKNNAFLFKSNENILHLGKAFMLNQYGEDSMMTWDAVKKLRK